MDWFTWLSKTSLDPSLVYEYGLAFSHNELERDDIPYFNHEFLQSMGISIAKHRLEILKLARKEKGSTQNPMSRILVAIKRTKRSFSNYFHSLIHHDDSSLALVPQRSNYSSSRWKNAMVKRNKRLVVAKQSRGMPFPLLLTNGSPMHSSRINSFSSPMTVMVQDLDQKMGQQDCEEYWSSHVEEMRWDTMFHNLKPT